MTDEILQKYQIRKSNKQKDVFCEYLKTRLQKSGYDPDRDIHIEKRHHGIFRSQNIIVGDVDNAKLLITAHYDTCAVLPFPNLMAPLNTPLFILAQFLLVIIILLLSAIPPVIIAVITWNPVITYFVWLITLYFWIFHMLIGFRNPHTANDNTSGVITLTHVLEVLPEEARKNVAVVYFDNEEKGLFGSAFFTSKHKEIKKSKLIINVDCIGDGDTIAFLVKKSALKDAVYKDFEASFNEIKCNHAITFLSSKMKAMMFPSDQSNFKKGVGVCALNTTPIGHLVWRIHTPFDTICKEENIDFFVDGVLNWCRKM